MTKRNVMITIRTERSQVAEELFAEFDEALLERLLTAEVEPESQESTEMMVEGRLVTGASRVEVVYDESAASGMGGSVTTIGFDRSHPGLISMMRTGTIYSAFVFEEGKRHVSVYDTPFSSFDICVRTLRVQNELLQKGRLGLEYLIEIHGAQAERCRMEITVRKFEELFAD